MIMMKVIVTVKPSKQMEFLQTVRSLICDQHRQTGLSRTSLVQDGKDKTSFSMVYLWESQTYLDLYLGSETFKVLLGAIKVLCYNLEIIYEPIPEE